MTLDTLLQTIKANQEVLLSDPGVLHVEPEFTLSGEELQPAAILVITGPGYSGDRLPDRLDNIPVRTRPVTAQEYVDGFLPFSVWEGISPEADFIVESFHGYTPPDPAEVVLLERAVHNITCHVGPDSGWSNLQPFLENTTRSLTVAMYDFNAGYIIDTINVLGQKPNIQFSMILDVDSRDNTMPAPLQASWGNRLDFVKAAVNGPNRIFDTAYHTKVAVRDSSAFWLSSGNWTRSSQPLIGEGDAQVLYTKGNREWHLIIEDEPLAQMYEKFIKYDIRIARPITTSPPVPRPDLLIPESVFLPEAIFIQDHPFVAKTFALPDQDPIRVKALMSPDNYAAEILTLIQSAQQSLYLQFSYIRQPSVGLFDSIITAISQKMEEGVDVRILVGRNQKDAHSSLLISQRGWKSAMFRKQTSNIHNKGILIDGQIAVVGSNNWSSDGTLFNRDTSLVMFSTAITDYYKEVFLFDWENLSQPILGSPPEIQPVIAPETGLTPPGMVRIPWQTWFDD